MENVKICCHHFPLHGLVELQHLVFECHSSCGISEGGSDRGQSAWELVKHLWHGIQHSPFWAVSHYTSEFHKMWNRWYWDSDDQVCATETTFQFKKDFDNGTAQETADSLGSVLASLVDWDTAWTERWCRVDLTGGKYETRAVSAMWLVMVPKHWLYHKPASYIYTTFQWKRNERN